MKFRSRSARAVVATVALSVGLSGAALAATAGTAAAEDAVVSAKQAKKAKKTKVDIKDASLDAYLNSETKKPYAYVYGQAKLKINVPAAYKGGNVYGEVVGKLGGKKVKGSIYPFYNSKKEKQVLKKPVTFYLEDVSRKATGKQVELTKVTWTFYNADYSIEPAVVTKKLKSNKVRAKRAGSVAVYHFPKKKVLTLRGKQAYTGKSKKKYKDYRKRPNLGGITVLVQKAKNKKNTKWKTLGRVRLDGKGSARFSKGVTKKGVYRVKFAGNARHNKFESWSTSWSGKPTKAGWPKKKAKLLSGGGQGGGRVAPDNAGAALLDQARAEQARARRAQR